MQHASTELKQQLPCITICLVLLYGILNRLLRQIVLEFERGDRQTVDEQTKVKGKPGLVTAVVQLSCHSEAVGCVPLLRHTVARRRCAVEEVDLMGSVLQA